MNSDLHTLAFTAQDSAAMRRILRNELPAEIHLIHTAALDPKVKTEKLVALYNDFRTLEAMLAWEPRDEAMGRALRQLNTEGVIKLRELVMGAVPDGEEPGPGVAGALRVINRALSAPLEASRLAFPIGNVERPRAQA